MAPFEQIMYTEAHISERLQVKMDQIILEAQKILLYTTVVYNQLYIFVEIKDSQQVLFHKYVHSSVPLVEKLATNFEGPFSVISASRLYLILQIDGWHITVNVDQVHPYCDNRNYPELIEDCPVIRWYSQPPPLSSQAEV